jgi:hypothetical protein
MRTEEIIEVKKKSIQKWPKVAIIILNWNGWKDTIECLESVFRNTYPNYQVIVIDNGSTDGSLEKIKNWADGKQEVLTPDPSHPLYHLSHPSVKKPIPYIYYNREEAEKSGNFILEEKVTKEWQKQRKANIKELTPTSTYPLIFIQTSENLGYAGGNNVGIRYVLKKDNYNFVWILNNDTVIKENALVEIVKRAKDNKKIGILGPEIYFYEKSEILHSCGAKMNLWTGRGKFIKYKKNNRIYNKNCTIDWVSGAAIILKVEMLERVGLFFEDFFLTYEETDLCCRARRASFKINTTPFARIWHKGMLSRGDPVLEYYLTRNRLIFMKRNANIIQYFSFLCFYFIGTLKRFLLFIIQGKNKVAKAILKGVFSGISK